MRRTFRLLVLALLACGLAGAALADRYVAQNGQTPASPYDSWQDAATDIQTAVNAASAGETVWVSTGVYTRASSPVVSIDKSLSLISVVTNAEAVIDGEGNKRGIFIEPSAPIYVLIDGFTITNGYQLNNYGGGIYVDATAVSAGTVVVQNCVMVTNRAELTAAPSGGALASRSTAGSIFLTQISNCRISNNYAGTSGGGLYFDYTSFEIENCRIENNQVDVWDPFATPPIAAAYHRGGGGIAAYHPGPGSTIRNSIIVGNRASRWGGGILSRYDGELTIENCEIRGNIAPSGAGILIAQHTGDPTNILRNCLISHNWALTNNITTSYGRGGGIKIGDTTLLNGRNVRMENCTVVSNVAVNIGGGIRMYTANGMTVWNSIVYGNWSGDGSTSNYQGTVAAWTNSLVGTGNVLPGSGNITDQAPGVLDFDGGNYRLTRTSPCVDEGYYQAWMDDARDLDGYHRIHPITDTVDIGAYEYQPQGTLISIR